MTESDDDRREARTQIIVALAAAPGPGHGRLTGRPLRLAAAARAAAGIMMITATVTTW